MDGAPFVRVVLDAAYLLALAAWAGSLLFATFGADPAGPGAVARWRRAYAWGVTCGAIALPAGLGMPLSHPESRGPWVAVQAALVLAATLAMVHGSHALAPVPDGGAAGRAEDLRRRVRRLNAAVLIALGVLIVAFAARSAPTPPGPHPNIPDADVPRPPAAPGTGDAEP